MAFTAIKIDEHTKAIESGGDYRTVNPIGYVPALLLDDGTLLTEGAAIVQYIADQVPSKRLAPLNGTIERAKLQAWLNFFSSEMHKGAFGPIFHKGVSEESKDVFRDRLRTRYTHLDRHLADHEYLMGKDFTIADANSFAVTTQSDCLAMSGFRPNRTGQAGLLMSVDRGRPEVSGIRSNRREQPEGDTPAGSRDA